ncbi:serine hydrolase domain-containing protein [Kribbella sp. CA-294648]|uniref:serine hydrolase domain-containing protein n=1 Tax=Kribbella sp. CA-294648 TaxID=3239948 RepID=UPI003D94490D
MFVQRTIAAVAVTAALFAAGAATAATASANIIEDPAVDTAAMGTAIEKALAGKTTGFAYAIAKNGQYAKSGKAGKARTGPDGDVNFTTSTRFDIASATKTFTAAAVLKLLEAKKYSVDSPVKPYLPIIFQQEAHASWNGVTFRHLLAHTSGMNQTKLSLSAADAAKYNKSYAGLRFAVSKAVKPELTTDPLKGQYDNMNYAMLRLTIPALWRQVDPNRGVPTVNATNSGPWALEYMNEHLLVPAGIAPTTCTAVSPATAALGYNLNNVAAGGHLFQLAGAGFEQCAGHRGLHLSAMDLVRWQAHLAHGTIVSANVRRQMDSGNLGWKKESNGTNREGMYWHGGQLTAGGEINSCHAKFPGGVEASVLYNSQHLNDTYSCSVLVQAYLASK